MPKPSITKANTVETFTKALADLRVGKDAVSYFLERLNILAEAVVKSAETNAKTEKRKTIMAKDIEVAMTDVTGSTSDLAFLFKQIEALDAKETVNLSEMINKWVEAH